MKEPVEDRFWRKVVIAGPDECWLWQAYAKENNGYGQFGMDGRMQLAHRVAYSMSVGDIPDGMKVLHSCDTPLCVNPRHLFLGTQLDNMRDKMRKGRTSRTGRGPAGEKSGASKLTNKIVRDIRRLHATGEHTYAALAIQFSSSAANIRSIVKYETWKHVVKRIERKRND